MDRKWDARVRQCCFVLGLEHKRIKASAQDGIQRLSSLAAQPYTKVHREDEPASAGTRHGRLEDWVGWNGVGSRQNYK